MSTIQGGLASLFLRLSRPPRRRRGGPEPELRQRPLSGDEAFDAWAVLEAMERGVPHPTAKIFWFKHFTPPAPAPAAMVSAAVRLPPTLVPWDEFARAFAAEFGPHPEESLERFKQVSGWWRWHCGFCGLGWCLGWMWMVDVDVRTAMISVR